MSKEDRETDASARDRHLLIPLQISHVHVSASLPPSICRTYGRRAISDIVQAVVLEEI